MESKDKTVPNKILKVAPVLCVSALLFLSSFRKEISSTLYWTLFTVITIAVFYLAFKIKPSPKRMYIIGGFVSLTVLIMVMFLYR